MLIFLTMIKTTRVISRILELIEKKNVSKITDFAKELELTPAGVHRYIKRLKKAKAIRYGFSVNYTAFGHIQAMLLFEMYRPLDKDVMKDILKTGFVKKVMRTEGDYDYVVFAVFRNEEELRNFLMSTLSYNDRIKGYKIAILGGGFI
jgi:DNA-binding Lrp family transcriptional regulator